MPIAPNVQMIPTRTTGSGSSCHLACLNAMKSTTTIRSDEIMRSGPMLAFISYCIASMKTGSPVIITLYPAGKSAHCTISSTTASTSIFSGSVTRAGMIT